MFTTDFSTILDNISKVDPVRYAKSRNFINGGVTYLSPYISRGVISTRQVLDALLKAGYKPYQMEKFIQELAWRDYWQQVWVANKHAIDQDLKHPQPSAKQQGIPSGVIKCQTGITGIDVGIEKLYQTGYMHNHVRMYLASVSCNIAKCGWKVPAQWMYYHLQDGDWASNALSWQWVCGANSNKLYFANQENINKYCGTSQQHTFLDVPYEQFESLPIPDALSTVELPELETPLPTTTVPLIDPQLPTLVYNYYNLDPKWRSELKANRVLLLEPSVFKKYPVSNNCVDFCISLAKNNLPDIQIFVAEFSDLKKFCEKEIYFKEHPLNNYTGIEDARDWMTTVKGNFPSFFSFWKKCEKQLL